MNIVTEPAFIGWIAYDDDTYDGAPEHSYDPGPPDGNPVGSGATEEEARNDLLEQLGIETEDKS